MLNTSRISRDRRYARRPECNDFPGRSLLWSKPMIGGLPRTSGTTRGCARRNRYFSALKKDSREGTARVSAGRRGPTHISAWGFTLLYDYLSQRVPHRYPFSLVPPLPGAVISVRHRVAGRDCAAAGRRSSPHRRCCQTRHIAPFADRHRSDACG